MLVNDKRVLTEYLRLCIKGIVTKGGFDESAFVKATQLSNDNFSVIMAEGQVVIPYADMIHALPRLGATVNITVYGRSGRFRLKTIAYRWRDKNFASDLKTFIGRTELGKVFLYKHKDLLEKSPLDVLAKLHEIEHYADVLVKSKHLSEPVDSAYLSLAGVIGYVDNDRYVQPQAYVVQIEEDCRHEEVLNRFVARVAREFGGRILVSRQKDIPNAYLTHASSSTWTTKCRALLALGAEILVTVKDMKLTGFCYQYKFGTDEDEERRFVSDVIKEWSNRRRVSGWDVRRDTGKNRVTYIKAAEGDPDCRDPLLWMSNLTLMGMEVTVKIAHPFLTKEVIGNIETTKGDPKFKTYYLASTQPGEFIPMVVNEDELTPAQRIHIPGQPLGTRHFL